MNPPRADKSRNVCRRRPGTRSVPLDARSFLPVTIDGNSGCVSNHRVGHRRHLRHDASLPPSAASHAKPPGYIVLFRPRHGLWASSLGARGGARAVARCPPPLRKQHARDDQGLDASRRERDVVHAVAPRRHSRRHPGRGSHFPPAARQRLPCGCIPRRATSSEYRGMGSPGDTGWMAGRRGVVCPRCLSRGGERSLRDSASRAALCRRAASA